MPKSFLIILILLFCAPTAVKALCTHCHRDTAYTKVYENSTHGKQKVDCMSCHVNNNIFRNLADKITGLATFSFSKVHLGAYANDKSCSKCHRAISRFNYTAKEALPEKLKDIGLNIGHKRHLELRDSCLACHAGGNLPPNPVFKFIRAEDPMSCAACHNNIAHAVPAKYDINFPMEDQCGYCHGKDRKCPSLQKISNVKDKSRCTECHPNQYTL